MLSMNYRGAMVGTRNVRGSHGGDQESEGESCWGLEMRSGAKLRTKNKRGSHVED